MHSFQSPRALSLLFTALLVAPLSAVAVEPVKEDTKKGPLPVTKLKRSSKVDFEKELLPILRRNCLSCHNSQ